MRQLHKNGVGREIVLRGSFGPDSRRQWEYSRYAGWVLMNMARLVR